MSKLPFDRTEVEHSKQQFEPSTKFYAPRTFELPSGYSERAGESALQTRRPDTTVLPGVEQEKSRQATQTYVSSNPRQQFYDLKQGYIEGSQKSSLDPLAGQSYYERKVDQYDKWKYFNPTNTETGPIDRAFEVSGRSQRAQAYYPTSGRLDLPERPKRLMADLPDVNRPDRTTNGIYHADQTFSGNFEKLLDTKKDLQGEMQLKGLSRATYDSYIEGRQYGPRMAENYEPAKPLRSVEDIVEDRLFIPDYALAYRFSGGYDKIATQTDRQQLETRVTSQQTVPDYTIHMPARTISHPTESSRPVLDTSLVDPRDASSKPFVGIIEGRASKVQGEMLAPRPTLDRTLDAPRPIAKVPDSVVESLPRADLSAISRTLADIESW